ncbi:MAG: hypothetical protein WKF34_01925 [Pyrinomonadaceae bacterium]
MIREWEEFHGGPSEPARERLHVTINPRCIILLNKKVSEALGDPASAMLLYDRRNQTIGIRAAGPGDIKPFPVKQHPKGSHRGIYAKPFCRHHKIIPTEHIRFQNPELDQDGVLTLDLHNTEPVEKKKRRPIMPD